MKIKPDNNKENYDAVKSMREIRDQLSREIMNMTYVEEKAYLKKLLAKKSEKSPVVVQRQTK